MNIYEVNDIGKLIENNSYVGRGIVLGKSKDGKSAVAAYFIMGRSENSRNRIFTKEEEGIRILPFDASKVEDPSLIIYYPVREIGNNLIVTNGDQTDTVYNFIKEGKSFEAALETREFEPDAPNFTPRISGMITFGEGEITKDANDLFIVGDAANVSFDQESELLDTAAAPVGHSLSNNINNTAKGWTLLQVETTNLSAGDDDADGVIQGYLVFTYSYNSMLANTDKVSEKYQELVGTTIVKQTTPLFDKIRMLNVIEGQLDLVTYQMPIKVFAIQAAHTGTGTDEDANIMADSNGNGIPNTTTEVIAQSKFAYETYSKQNADNGSATTLVSNFAS